MKKLLRVLIYAALAVVLAAVGLFGYLTVTEYKPQDVEPLDIMLAARGDSARRGEIIKLVSFNTGYAGLDRSQDFFMDGGERSRPFDKDEVEDNTAAILSALSQQKAQVCFLQEVDEDSSRSFGINQKERYYHGMSMRSAFAYNYYCDFVPIPWPPMGKVRSGIMTLSTLGIDNATRESLPVPFKWPSRVANLKRCMLVCRVPVEASEAELVLINVHLEAYDDGEGKRAQTEQIMSVIAAERRNGNYVIVGGDFNQSFEGSQAFEKQYDNEWMPAMLTSDELPEGFSYVFDPDTPTCRSLRAPYGGDRANTLFYIIDGYIVSDNIKVNNIETVDLNFRNSDHNPVVLEATLI